MLAYIVAWVGVLGGSTKAYHKILLGSQPKQNGLFLVQWETLLEDHKDTKSHRKRHMESCTGLHWYTHTHICHTLIHTITHGKGWEGERETEREDNYIVEKLHFSEIPSLRAVNHMIASTPSTSKCSIFNRKKLIHGAKKYWLEDIYL